MNSHSIVQNDTILTVVMTAYNAEDYVGLAVESILSQTFDQFKFIIVNNGSTDRTGKILDDYASRDSRISVLHHSGASTYVEGRERAIANVKSDWFALMDADDIAEPERLATQVRYINKMGDEVSVFGTWAETINEQGESLARMQMGPTTLKEFYAIYESGEAIVPLDPSTVIKLSAFQQAGGYRRDTVPASDLDLWYRIAEIGGAILIIPKFLMRYRIHSASTSVAQVMSQRLKTHYVNYNMRRRRMGYAELSWDEFKAQVWRKPMYRIPRLRNDFGLAYFKRAGHAFAEGKYLKMLLFITVSACFKPIHIIRQIVRNKLMQKSEDRILKDNSITPTINIYDVLKKLDFEICKDGLLILPVRNYIGLPKTNIGRDIDIAISRHDIAKWVRHLTTVAQKNGYILRSEAQYKYCRQFHLVAQNGDNLEIDLLPRFSWRGIEWLDEKIVIKSSLKHNEMIKRPKADHEFLITLNHSYLHGGFFPRKYLEHLIDLLSSNKEAILDLMIPVYGKEDSATILEMTASRNVDLLDQLNTKIRVRCLWRAFKRNPAELLSGFIGSYAYDYWLRLKKK